MEYEKVAEDNSLSEGGLCSVALANGVPVCLARVNGAVYAVRDECTHAEFPLSDGSLGPDYHLECAIHGAVFDVRDGSVQSPPAEDAVETYRVKVEDGWIWVAAPPEG